MHQLIQRFEQARLLVDRRAVTSTGRPHPIRPEFGGWSGLVGVL